MEPRQAAFTNVVVGARVGFVGEHAPKRLELVAPLPKQPHHVFDSVRIERVRMEQEHVRDVPPKALLRQTLEVFDTLGEVGEVAGHDLRHHGAIVASLGAGVDRGIDPFLVVHRHDSQDVVLRTQPSADPGPLLARVAGVEVGVPEVARPLTSLLEEPSQDAFAALDVGDEALRRLIVQVDMPKGVIAELRSAIDPESQHTREVRLRELLAKAALRHEAGDGPSLASEWRENPLGDRQEALRRTPLLGRERRPRQIVESNRDPSVDRARDAGRRRPGEVEPLLRRRRDRGNEQPDDQSGS